MWDDCDIKMTVYEIQDIRLAWIPIFYSLAWQLLVWPQVRSDKGSEVDR